MSTSGKFELIIFYYGSHKNWTFSKNYNFIDSSYLVTDFCFLSSGKLIASVWVGQWELMLISLFLPELQTWYRIVLAFLASFHIFMSLASLVRVCLAMVPSSVFYSLRKMKACHWCNESADYAVISPKWSSHFKTGCFLVRLICGF